MDALNAIRQCQRKEIDKLRQEVAEAEARASDAISCACQAHKEEAEAALNFGQEVSQKLEESRSQVQQLNSALDALKQNLEEKERALVWVKFVQIATIIKYMARSSLDTQVFHIP